MAGVPFPNLYKGWLIPEFARALLLSAFPAESNYTVVVCVSVCVCVF